MGKLAFCPYTVSERPGIVMEFANQLGRAL
jgi:hypothetical protein